MIGFCPLGSGSKGNCIYLGTKHTKVLIDAGLSGRAIKNRLAEIDVDINDIEAILITHEHSDHITGLRVLAYNLNIPIIANSETAKGIADHFKAIPRFKIFATGESFEFADLNIHPFTIQHDTPDPVAFTINTSEHKLGFCTDLGYVTSLVEQKLRGCDYLYIEANHQPSMVHACSRPMVYKQRVLGRHGHLSNEACAKLLKDIYHENLKQIYLAHLSDECNSPYVAMEIIKQSLEHAHKDLRISIAHQNKVSDKTYFSTQQAIA